MRLSTFVACLLGLALAVSVTTGAEPISFPEAIKRIEAVVAKQNVPNTDLVEIDEVLTFVSRNIPQSAAAPSQSPSSSGNGYWKQSCYRTRFGRCCCCWVWVSVPPRRYRSSESLVRERVTALQIAIADFGNDPAVRINDLALQVYGITLTVDRSQPGRIER
jgi:hypothetical protein